MKKILSVLILALAFSFIATLGFSSYYATGVLRVQIIQINTRAVAFEDTGDFMFSATFKVVEFLRGDGHNPDHAKPLVGKTFTANVFCDCLWRSWSILAGKTLIMQYYYSDGLAVDETGKVTERSGELWRVLEYPTK